MTKSNQILTNARVPKFIIADVMDLNKDVYLCLTFRNTIHYRTHTIIRNKKDDKIR